MGKEAWGSLWLRLTDGAVSVWIGHYELHGFFLSYIKIPSIERRIRDFQPEQPSIRLLAFTFSSRRVLPDWTEWPPGSHRVQRTA